MAVSLHHTTSETSAPHNAKEKQFRVQSEVKCACVVGHSVWLGHNDGTVTIRRARSAEVVRHFCAGGGARVWSMIHLSLGAKGSFVWLGLSNGDIEVHSVEKSEAAAQQRCLNPQEAAKPVERTAAGQVNSCMQRLQRHTGGVYTLAEFNAYVYSGSNDFEIMQWDAKERAFLRQFTGHSNYVRALHAEGSLLVSASDDKTVRVWNSVNGSSLSVGRFHKHGVSTLCRVGVDMWSGDDNGTIFVWKMQTVEVVDTLTEHLGRVCALRKVGSRVYSGGADGVIIIWDAYTRALVSRITDHKGWILGLTCPAQLCRYYVWSESADSTVRCWHHDEYRVMSSDFERFDDARWFHTESTPFKELNQTLIDRLTTLEASFNKGQRDLLSGQGERKGLQSDLEQAKQEIQDLKHKVEELTSERDEANKISEQRHGSIETKEKELNELAEKLKHTTSELVTFKCQNEALTEDMAELKRKLAIAESERDTYKGGLDKTLEVKRLGGAGSDAADVVAGIGVKPLVLTTPSEATAAVERLSIELNNALGLNLTMKEDLDRFKKLSGRPTSAATHTPRRPGAHSPSKKGAASPPLVTVQANSKGNSVTTYLPPGEEATAGYESRGTRWSTDNISALVSDRYRKPMTGLYSKKPSMPQSARSSGGRKAF